MATVRYIVRDVGAAVGFYTEGLGFELQQQFGPAMAIVKRGDLRLWVAGPQASASRPMPDGRKPEPGGRGRFVLEVDDIEGVVRTLKSAASVSATRSFQGQAGRQTLCEDPSGNVVELFEAAK